LTFLIKERKQNNVFEIEIKSNIYSLSKNLKKTTLV